MRNGNKAALAALAWVAVACVMSACGGGAGACPPGTEAVGEGCVEARDAGPLADGGTPFGHDDGGGDGGNPVDCDPIAVDEVDLTDRDDDCDGVDGMATAQWYVAPDGDDANVGSIEAPFATIGQALRATPQRPILVAAGSYEEQFVGWATVRERVALHGGYDPVSWRRSPGQRSTVRVSAAGQEMRFFDGSPELVLERIDLVGEDADPAEPGASAIALILRADATATGARVVLRDTVVRSGRGAAGALGADGETGVPGRTGIEGCACIDASGRCSTTGCTSTAVPSVATPDEAGFCREHRAQGGNGGGSRMVGQPSTAGRTGGGTGDYANGDDGEDGRAGDVGRDGAAAASSLGELELTSDRVRYVAPTGEGGAAGQAGEGGGGGGGGGFSSLGELCVPGDITSTTTAPAGGGGSGGDGGCGGGGGAAGGAGGASIAVIARGVTVVLEDARINTSAAGLGGNGGSGGIGGEGGGGGAVRNDRGEVAGLGSRFVCGVRSGGGQMRSRAGGRGGSGGAGGDGGAGAGGAGGASIGIALLERASLERDAASSFGLGAAGVGGSSAGSRGPDGVRVEVSELRER